MSTVIPRVSGATEGTGHLQEFNTTPLDFLHRAYEECGEIGEFDLGGLRTVLLVGPEAHEAFFRAPDEQLSAAQAYQMMVPVFGEGIQYGAPPDIERLTLAAHAFLASTPSMLALLQVDDLSGEREPVNLPATSTEHPNWRRRQALTLEELAASPEWKVG